MYMSIIKQVKLLLIFKCSITDDSIYSMTPPKRQTLKKKQKRPTKGVCHAHVFFVILYTVLSIMIINSIITWLMMKQWLNDVYSMTHTIYHIKTYAIPLQLITQCVRLVPWQTIIQIFLIEPSFVACSE